jgi:hypothetical protein
MEFSGSMSKIYSIMYLQLTVKYVMKYLYTLIALWTFTVTAHSEPRELSKRIICDTRNSIFTQLIEDYKEQPVWHGVSPAQNTELMLTVNKETGAWTLIEYAADWACVLGVGENSSSRWGISI